MVAVLIACGEAGVASYETYQKTEPYGKAAAYASAVPVFIGAVPCNFYLVRDDTIDFLTKLSSGKLFKTKDGKPLSWKVNFCILLGILGGALPSGIALSALELQDNQKIFGLGPAIILASGASIGFTAIYATVITDFIKKSTLSHPCDYLKTCNFIIEFCKILVGQTLNIIYCITQYYVFRSSVPGFFTQVLKTAAPPAWVIECIVLATVITDGFFGARKIQEQLDKFQQCCISVFHYCKSTTTRTQDAKNTPTENNIQKTVNTYLSRMLFIARVCLLLNTVGMVALNITDEAEDALTNLIPVPVNETVLYILIALATIARSAGPNNNAMGDSFDKDRVTPLAFFSATEQKQSGSEHTTIMLTHSIH